MDKLYVCRKCGFTIREIELADWPKHDFVNRDNIAHLKIPDYDRENDCEKYELWEEDNQS